MLKLSILSTIILSFILLAGCEPLVDIGIQKVNQPTITITSPQASTLFNNKSVTTALLSGKCTAGHQYLITSPVRSEITCSNSLWSHTLDLTLAPEGPFQIVLEDVTTGSSQSFSYQKRFFPPHVTSFFKNKIISAVQDLFHSDKSEPKNYLLYASDEFCSTSECNALNIVIRFRSDDYLTPYHVTSDKLISSTSPMAFTVDTEGNNLRIFYLSSDTITGAKNIYSLDFNTVTKISGAPRKITAETVDSVSSYQIINVSDSQHHLFYLSREYCRSNACSVDKISWRNSTDNYSTVAYLGDHTQCGISQLRSSIHKPSGDLHLAYSLIDGGSCSAGTTREHMKYSAGTWTRQSFSFTHFPASRLIVDNSGEAYLFYRSYAGWEGGSGCSSWDLRYRKSSEAFATRHLVPGGCPYSMGYPADSHAPAVALDASGNVKLATGLYPPYAFTLSSSSDNFSTFTTHASKPFARQQTFLQLITPDSGDEIFYVSSASPAGLVRVQINGGSEIESKLVGISSFYSTTDLGNGEIGFIGISDQYCKENGCSNDNFILRRESSSAVTWLTTIQQSNLYLSYPSLIQGTGELKLFYSSNELGDSVLNIHERGSSDNYQTRTDISSASTPGAVNSVFTATKDSVGKIHLLGRDSASANFVYRNSDDYNNLTPLTSMNNLGNDRVIMTNSPTGEVGIIYGSNEVGGWRANIRWSNDAFSSIQYTLTESTANYYRRNIVWNPGNNLEVYYIADLNSDGRWQVAKKTSSDNWTGTSEPFTLTTQSVCRPTSKGVVAKYNSAGRLFILYSAATDGNPACQLYVKSDDDWSQTWRLTTDWPTQTFEPLDIFLQGTALPKVCATNSFSLFCFDLSRISRQ